MSTRKKATAQQNSTLFPPSNRQAAKGVFRTLTLVDQIVHALKQDILTGRFKAGQQLLEDSLKDEFGISRTPLREAFRVLEKDGFVEILPRRGSFVKRSSKRDIAENSPVRASLEGLAARLAYGNLSQQDLDEMEELIAYMRQAAQEQDFIKYAGHHTAFHEIFINASGNQTLINLLRNLRMHTLWHRYAYQYFKTDFRHSLEIHREIMVLFKEKTASPEEVEQAVRQHIEAALDPFLAAMDKLDGDNTR